MSKNMKKVLSFMLCLTLVAALGASAFADNSTSSRRDMNGKTGTETTQQDTSAKNSPKNKPVPTEDHDDFDEFDDFDDFDEDDAYTFDMSEIIAQIKDPEERAKVESLYEEYMKSCEEEQKAYDNMISAEDAFFEALDDAEMNDDFEAPEMPEGEEPYFPTDDEFDGTMEDMRDLDMDEIMDILMQFFSWYNSVNNPTDSSANAPQPSSTPQASSSQPQVDANSVS